ncbi:MAG: Gfo/Idh/MocA family oxidoreductase [Kiritimatiellales bacterium]|jgi:predicted dehydrogenase
MAGVKSIIVGAGDVARYHISVMISMGRTTGIAGLVEPGEAPRAATAALFSERGLACPPFYTTIRELIKAQGAADAAVICSPHKFHFEHARDCLQNGMDVLIEKPMVMNGAEARRLIKLRNKTGRLVMVALPGSLSPAIWKAKQLLAQGAIGKVTAISAFAHQDWKRKSAGTWRMVPEISGGGFLFDTGSHMINTAVDLLGADVACVTALLDNRNTPVEINSSVSGLSANGVMLSLAGVGDSVQCCSQILVFGDRGILRTGMWGDCLFIKKAGETGFKPVPYRKSRGPWEQFLRVRSGRIENPCPPEIGLRFANLMDMIRRSAETGRTVMK